MTFAKATKKKSKLRLAVFGPSGAGKTYTSLSIAKGLGGKVALIDTERGSASKYADRFEFDVADLETPTIENYTNMIGEAKSYDVLVIDSLSHAWQELLEQVDKIAQAKYRGNSWSAWSEGTPKQRKFVDAILSFPGHVITTMRSKTEWAVSSDDKGKTKPTRVGLAPEQGKGIEYEFDMLIEMNVDNVGHVIKDRTGKYQSAIIEKPGVDLGKELAGWLKEGEIANPLPENWIARLEEVASAHGVKKTDLKKMVKTMFGKDSVVEMTADECVELVTNIKETHPLPEAEPGLPPAQAPVTTEEKEPSTGADRGEEAQAPAEPVDESKLPVVPVPLEEKLKKWTDKPQTPPPVEMSMEEVIADVSATETKVVKA